MKRIGIDAHMLGDHSGGNEVYYTNILKAMDVPSDMKIFLFVKPGIDVSAYKDKFNIVYFKSKTAFVRNFVELTYLCIKYKLDILHTQYFIPFIRPCKVVVTIHDICFEHLKDIFTKKEYIRQKLLIPYAARKSAIIFTVSEFSKKDISDTYNIDPSKIIVTYNAVDENFHPLSEEEINRAELKESYGIDRDYILTVGNLQPRKNIVRLIQAFALLQQEYKDDLQLVIVGKKAWMYDEIFVEASSGTNNIIFTDYVDEKDLVRLYNGAKCFVYPSLYEGFGIPPVEALACGTPVTVSNTSSLPEVVGDSGVFFDPTNIEEIKNSIEKVIKMKKPCREADKQFHSDETDYSWKKSASLIIAKYKRI